MSAETCSLFPAALARPANKENGGRGALSIPPCDLCKFLGSDVYPVYYPRRWRVIIKSSDMSQII